MSSENKPDFIKDTDFVNGAKYDIDPGNEIASIMASVSKITSLDGDVTWHLITRFTMANGREFQNSRPIDFDAIDAFDPFKGAVEINQNAIIPDEECVLTLEQMEAIGKGSGEISEDVTHLQKEDIPMLTEAFVISTGEHEGGIVKNCVVRISRP